MTADFECQCLSRVSLALCSVHCILVVIINPFRALRIDFLVGLVGEVGVAMNFKPLPRAIFSMSDSVLANREVLNEMFGLFHLQTIFSSFNSVFYGRTLPSESLRSCTKFLS